MTQEFPARLHVLLASAAPRGVVIRRGPSQSVATVLWDRRDDTFRLGQWLRGRIYERRSDLSPDGRRLLYFAMNGKWDEESKGAWTAVSRAPYLKALTFLPKGDCWHGGGLWTSNRKYWLNDGYGHEKLRSSWAARRDRRYEPDENWGGECPGVYYLRLQRDGWTLLPQADGADDSVEIFEKPLSHGWVLRKMAHAEVDHPVGKGCYWDAHELVQPATGKVLRRPDWEWAELDRERVVWAEGGKLFAGEMTPDGLADERELHDFNAMKFEAVPAPY